MGKDLKDQEEAKVQVKIRSTTKVSDAKITKISNNQMKVRLVGAERAVTPGQACVIYDKQRVLGGGWITREIF